MLHTIHISTRVCTTIPPCEYQLIQLTSRRALSRYTHTVDIAYPKCIRFRRGALVDFTYFSRLFKRKGIVDFLRVFF